MKLRTRFWVVPAIVLVAAYVFVTNPRLSVSRAHSRAIPDSFTASLTGDARVYSVEDYGARGDGKTLDTAAINKAIDAAAADGGGTVRFPAC